VVQYDWRPDVIISSAIGCKPQCVVIHLKRSRHIFKPGRMKAAASDVVAGRKALEFRSQIARSLQTVPFIFSAS
jgi:hypothetical protein